MTPLISVALVTGSLTIIGTLLGVALNAYTSRQTQKRQLDMPTKRAFTNVA